MGPDWTGGQGGQARINEIDDPVRFEIETALDLKLPIIPVLIGSTTMPSSKWLPPGLSEFPSLNAARVDPGTDFDHHMQRLIAAIDKKLGRPQSFVAALLIIDGADSLLRGLTRIGAAGDLTMADAAWAGFGVAELLTAAGTLFGWPLTRWIGAAVCACGVLLSLQLVVGTELSFEDHSAVIWAVHQYAFAALFTIACVFYVLGWQHNIGNDRALNPRLARSLSVTAFLLFVVVAALLSVADLAAQAATASEFIKRVPFVAVASVVMVYFFARMRREWHAA